MDPVNPWLDPSEVRHLAEQLLRPVAPARLSAADPGFDKSFVGFTDTETQPAETLPPPATEAPRPHPFQAALPVSPARDIPQDIPAPAHAAPAVSPRPAPDKSEPQPSHRPSIPNLPEPFRETEDEDNAFTPAPPEPAHGKARFLERIEIFRKWLAKNFSATDIFILDREGKVIFDESGHGRLHFMARNLALASRNSQAQSGNVHVKIGPGAVLEVIPCETPYGRIVLGALVPESLPAPHVRTITEVLVQTASPG